MSSDGETFECDRCGGRTPIEEGAMLTQEGSKQLVKYLCPDCLEAVGVPRGYDLDRDVSHLRQ